MKDLIKKISHRFRLDKQNVILLFFIILIVLLSIVYFKDSTIPLSYEGYEKLIETKNIQKAVINGDKVLIKYDSKIYSVLSELIDLKELYKHTIVVKQESNFAILIPFYFILSAIAIVFAIQILVKLSRKNRIQQDKKEIIKEDTTDSLLDFTPVNSKYTFANVAGIDEIKGELYEIVDFLQNPSRYKSFGIKLPKGVIMFGPPGVGKTLIAKAIAGEANVPFFYQSGASFAEVYVGVGAKRVRELFAKAKLHAPSIIFIDEIDAVGKSRGDGRSDELESTLNQLLTEMDGFDENGGVLVIAATNRIDAIDKALLRSGRFDRRISISLPNYQDRAKIFKEYLKDKKCKFMLDRFVKLSVGFSGADIENLVNEAAMSALKRKSDCIEDADFESVIGRIIEGSKQKPVLTQTEREIQVLYQASKAVSAYWYNFEFEKITIMEDRFLNYDKFMESKTELLNKIKVYLSGSSFLKIFKKDSFSNSRYDHQKAYNLAYKIVYDYSMNENLVPTNSEVYSILQSAQEEINEFFRNNHLKVKEAFEILIRNEEITQNQVRDIFNQASS